MGALHVLVGVDGSPGSEMALRWAFREAALSAAKTEDGRDSGRPTVTALLSWTTEEPFGGVLRAATTSDSGPAQAAEQRLERSIERVGGVAPTVDLRRLVVPGEPIPALVEAAGDVDMVVVGTHGYGPFHRVNIGCVTQGVVYHSPVPVVVTRPADDRDNKTGVAGSSDDDRRPVVVGVDGSQPSLDALRWAARAAAIRQVPLRVMHGWGGYDPLYADVFAAVSDSLARQADEIVDQAVEFGLGDAPKVTVEPVVSSEPGVRALVRESEQAQLLVVGSRGLGGFERLLLGSVSHQCVLHAACDVAIVRSASAPATHS